jgi:hypothetical protein
VEGLRIYLPGETFDAMISIRDTPTMIEQKLRPLADADTVWLVRYRDRTPHAIDIAERILGPYYAHVGIDSPKKIDILEFHPVKRSSPAPGPS